MIEKRELSVNTVTILSFLIITLFYTAIASAYGEYIEITDKTRNRIISLEIYETQSKNYLPVVIISHGKGVKNTEYSFIANALANQRYFIISIQHMLPSDPPLIEKSTIFATRKPAWEHGVQNIYFIMNSLQKAKPYLNCSNVILIGHSGGGDISMMFADRYPELISKIISLDSLRYPFPIDKGIPILHFGASDTKVDPGVVPTQGINTILIKGARHMDFCDNGDPRVKEEVLKSIVQFLNSVNN